MTGYWCRDPPPLPPLASVLGPPSEDEGDDDDRGAGAGAGAYSTRGSTFAVSGSSRRDTFDSLSTFEGAGDDEMAPLAGISEESELLTRVGADTGRTRAASVPVLTS